MTSIVTGVVYIPIEMYKCSLFPNLYYNSFLIVSLITVNVAEMKWNIGLCDGW